MAVANSDIRIVAHGEELCLAAAEEFVRQATEAVRVRGLFTIALSGGSTPKGVYSLLARDGESSLGARLPWDRIHFFWGDERHVPPDHADSNFRMAHEAMLSKAPVPPANVHRIKTENPDAEKAAADYEQTLREFFRLAPGQVPRLDLVLLGMGPDGHTASLFPGSSAVCEESRLVAAPWVEKLKTYRVTLTAPVINNASCVIFLVAGADKAPALREVLQGRHQPELYPAQIVRPTDGALLWMVDRAAASLL